MGGEISTPNIDRLAQQGILFTQFHVTPNCSSTRASLMTGMDHHLTGLGTHGPQAKNQKGQPGYEGYLNNKVVTIAEVLQDSGYRTMMAGKWHLGNVNKETWPSGRGFDDSFALLNGGASHWDSSPLLPSKPSYFVDNNKLVKALPDDFYSSDYFTDKIISYVETNVKTTNKPFFAFLSFTAPHNPLHAPKELIEKYQDYYHGGWDKLQLTRLHGLKNKGLVDKQVKPQPRPDWIPAWDSLSASQQEMSARTMAVYAAMIDRVDQNIGRLVASLKAQGKFDNTVILVFSDNGPSKTTMADYMALDGKGSQFIASFDNQLDNVGLANSNVDLGSGWAYGLAAPLRLMKGYQTQGGVLSPLIVKAAKTWPKTNQRVTSPVHVMDLMPTFLEIAGAKHPAAIKGNDLLLMQGSSLLSVIQGNDSSEFDKRGFGSELFGIKAYRLGQWKIIKLPPPYGTARWQLYDLNSDPGETSDLARKHLEKTKQLIGLWHQYADTNGVIIPDELILYAKPPN